MPCEYVAIDMKQRNLEQQKEEQRKKEVERKRKVLLLLLDEMGFTDIKEESLGMNKLMITGNRRK